MTTFRNCREAIFLWGFALAFVFMLLAITGILVRDGPPPGYSLLWATISLAVFWTAAIGLSAFVSTKPCIRVTLTPAATVAILWRYPFRTEHRELPCSAVGLAMVVETADSENDPYFQAHFDVPDSTRVVFAEGHFAPEVEQACIRFNSALARALGR